MKLVVKNKAKSSALLFGWTGGHDLHKVSSNDFHIYYLSATLSFPPLQLSDMRGFVLDDSLMVGNRAENWTSQMDSLTDWLTEEKIKWQGSWMDSDYKLRIHRSWDLLWAVSRIGQNTQFVIAERSRLVTSSIFSPNCGRHTRSIRFSSLSVLLTLNKLR